MDDTSLGLNALRSGCIDVLRRISQDRDTWFEASFLTATAHGRTMSIPDILLDCIEDDVLTINLSQCVEDHTHYCSWIRYEPDRFYATLVIQGKEYVLELPYASITKLALNPVIHGGIIDFTTFDFKRAKKVDSQMVVVSPPVEKVAKGKPHLTIVK